MTGRQKLIIAIPLVAMLIAAGIGLSIHSKNKLIEREIKEVEERISNDDFSKSDIDDLETEEGKDFAKKAYRKYHHMTTFYPEPKVTILNEHEVQEIDVKVLRNATVSTIKANQYVIKTGSNDPLFALKFRVDTKDEPLGKATENVPVITSLTADVKNSERDTDGVYSYQLTLNNEENDITLVGKNKYKETELRLVIVREPNEEEQKLNKIIEDADREWQASKAGKICQRHPDWDRGSCEDLANNRVWIGMSYEMLIELRGKPNSATPSNYGSGTEWQWCWWGRTPNCFYDDNDDGLIDSYN